MSDKRTLFNGAMAKALLTRKRLGIAIDEAAAPLDAAEKLGVEVRLADFPSMEGMYVSSVRPTIVLSSMRPQGRRHFTCAHELGHHAFGHGEQFDELVKDRSYKRATDSKEFQADCFAAFLLMPKATVESGMTRRKLSYNKLDALTVYGLSNWLGVGYSTLINHMVKGIGTMSRTAGDQLLKHQPRDIRVSLVGDAFAGNHVILADEHWRGRAIDCEVGDLIRLPPGTKLEGALQPSPIAGYVMAKAPGIARVVNDDLGWCAFVRMSKRKFNGRACFRFEEDADE